MFKWLFKKKGCAKHMNNKLEVIGIDHGWSMMKTISQVFVTGVKEITTTPALFGDVLEYEGKFYKVGTVRQEVKDTKVEDDSFYLLTLAAVAKELKRRGLAEAKVFLAVGLPLTRFGAEKNDFIKYLTKNKRVSFKYENEPYYIEMDDVAVFPQCYAAVVDKIPTMAKKTLIVDIGSWTIDIMPVINKSPDESKCVTIPKGLITCMRSINEQCVRQLNGEVDESEIQNIMRYGRSDIDDEYFAIIKAEIEDFVDKVYNSIREFGYNLKTIESDIIKQQRVRNKNNDFSTEISYAKRTEKKEIEEIMDDVRENDQCLFFVGVTIILMAESKKELESVCETVETIGKRNSCTIDTHYLKQREALNTALPIGVRQVETMRTLLTQSLAVLMPFNVQELNDSTGNYYGINQISKNVNIGNRKKLINGNGFVFGVPGSGKSFFCKMEMGSVFLSGDDEIIVIDPMNEYFDIAETYGGTVVNMSTYTDNYVNPLEMDVWSLDPNDSKGMVREKGEFMLGLCEQCIGDSLNSRQKSIIDRCVRKLYIDIARSKEKYIPVMSDFYDILMAQPEDEAKDIALSLELFVNGSLNIFNHQTNVDVDNRFTVYGIRDLGTELSPITMLVMMESIQNRIVENGKRGKATWLYIDEFHVLLNSEYSAKYLQQLWKKVRKQGGLCTGITQNVVDLLQNYTATTMLANSEFVALLKQANTDSSKMAEVIGVSEAQLRFVTNTASGMGLIKCGSVVIPFDNQISKDTDLYRLYNTNIHEKIAEQKKKEAMLQ